MDIKERFYANLDLIREEAEQLDELGDTWKGKKKLQKLKWRALDRYYKTNDTKKRDMHMKTFKKAYLKLPIGMDEEAEQLDEISKKLMIDYMSKADKEVKDIEKKFKKGTDTPDDDKKLTRRVKGMNIARDKFYKRSKVQPTGKDKAYSTAQSILINKKKK